MFRAGTHSVILVRDSKNPTGPALSFAPAEFSAFLNRTKSGEFDHVLA